MSNKILKILSIIIILVTTIIPCGFYTNVKAEGLTITTDNTKSNPDDNKFKLVTNKTTLTVMNWDSGDEFTAYKILDTFYNSSTNEISYNFTAQFKSFLSQNPNYQTLTIDNYFKLTSDDQSPGYTGIITASTLNELVS